VKEKSTEGAAESRPVWESLEAFARQEVQRLLQQLLEEEVEQALGRRRYERREGVDAPSGYRHRAVEFRKFLDTVETAGPRRPFDPRQLWDAQDAPHSALACAPPALPRALHADRGVLDQPGRTVVFRPHRETAAPRRAPQYA